MLTIFKQEVSGHWARNRIDLDRNTSTSADLYRFLVAVKGVSAREHHVASVARLCDPEMY